MKKEGIIAKTEEEIVKLLKPRLPRRTYREFEEILFSEFISVNGGVLAGALLAQFMNKLSLVPGILILMPGFLAMRGNISGALAARLGAALHLGLLRSKYFRSVVKTNVFAEFVLSIFASLFLGIVAFFATLWFFDVSAPEIIIISLLACIISNLVIIPITTQTTVWLFRKGYDPDNIMGPYITTIGDVVSVLSLIIAVMVV